MGSALVLAAVLAVCTLSDLRTRTVPDRAMLAGAAAAIAIIAVTEPALLGPRLLAALGAGGFLLAPALVVPGSIGLGDVKLAALLGLFLGGAVVTALLAAFLAGTLAGVVLMLRFGWEARKMTMPFVPFLALGAVVAL